ncbi:MAG: CRISPR-associated endoribonuclease Cas6 [Candidatus Parvarchaeota archaeon]|nr:CRISPR-associated endoribonuclease Cas6 [Candidatus Jingweiarchaeum tengchongense]MCW1298084.1 CRISPR-associated endoribonuclease Cas6 [Candidatus Jingweiarchaeum tengchongense]MCW1300801.1 CRISPR-associated endoribonuclease Cas6 [Candidatus Jingweiarchaeum tengchongense]MCW1304934.1 CRISPR-associated endoribonuclease Cas6 [Candidatus Jingweiarchaeum tengchongense]MCW1305506.1 CRISPR-associated endoribonuclease Cas6 [Candidatus Jingweiarchaeum tengchongense]
MRILIELQALKDAIYDNKYHHKLQGAIYNLLKNTIFSNLHSKKGYKFFCFSNIFPFDDIKTGDIRRFLISSPNKELINAIKYQIESDMERTINVGEMEFKVNDYKILKPKLGRSCSLITGTPIVMRIPRKNYKEYGMRSKYDYTYWRPNHPFEAFINQITENLFKKYNEFHGTEAKEFPIFQQFLLKKSVCNHVVIEGKEIKIFGSLWQFIFDYLDNDQREILQFGLETGLGELNSLGFGFMNVVK